MLTVIEHGEIVELSMDRPPVNALNAELVAELRLKHAACCDEGATAVVISGREGLFSAGLDVPVLLQQDRGQIEAFWESFFLLLMGLLESPVPVVAALTGHAPAGGAVLALHCDYRVATRGEFQIGLNEVKVGLPVPRNVLLVLQSVVGHRQAGLLTMAGEVLLPEAALRVGLVDELADPGDAIEAALKWARRITALPPQAMNTTRLEARAGLLDQIRAQGIHVATATDYWFSQETQATMHKLVQELAAGKS
jgi:3,2-trans-enoyl-CoA isomerase